MNSSPKAYKELLKELIPFFVDLPFLILVNPLIPIYDFDGQWLNLIKALDTRYSNGDVNVNSILLLISCMGIFIFLIALFMVFGVKCRKWLYVSIVYGLQFLLFASTLWPFIVGWVVIILTGIVGTLMSLRMYMKEKKASTQNCE